MANPLNGAGQIENRDLWWEVGTKGANSSFSSSLENILDKANAYSATDGLSGQASPSTVTGQSVTFEELLNSDNEQIRQFAVLDTQPLSQDWSVLKTTHPVTPSNFKSIDNLGDNIMLSKRFANALYNV